MPAPTQSEQIEFIELLPAELIQQVEDLGELELCVLLQLAARLLQERRE